jgi:hypothetical protein
MANRTLRVCEAREIITAWWRLVRRGLIWRTPPDWTGARSDLHIVVRVKFGRFEEGDDLTWGKSADHMAEG